MYAIIKTGGKQYRVSEGDELFVEKLEVEDGAEIVFNEVLAVGEGESMVWGRPLVEGASVKAELIKHGKGRKIEVFKYKAKKGYRKRYGHRQPYTKVKITAIEK